MTRNTARMLDYDDEIAWISQLDWTSHRSTSDGYLSRRLFLSSVAEVAGRLICEPWPLVGQHLLRHASNDHPGRMLQAVHAFDSDGGPIHSIHAALADDVRRHAERMLIPIRSSEKITFEEWQAVLDAGEDDWDLGLGARRAAAGIGPFLAKLAFDREIRCWARRKGGGDAEAVEIGPSYWDIDPELAIRRLASCGLDPARPYDADAEITHRIFVDDGGLQNALIKGSRTTYVATANLELGPWAIRREVDYYAVTTQAVVDFLISRMTDKNLHWTGDMFKAAIVEEFGNRGLGRVYEKARRIATSHPDRERFKVRRPLRDG
jgi:hypothetical protein